MRTAQHLPSGAIRDDELDRWFDDPGPFLSVYLDTEPAVERAPMRNELRWNDVRGALATAGATEPMLAAVDERIGDAHFHGRALAVVASARGHVHAESLEWQVRREFARVAPLPSVAPLLVAEQARVRHLIVLADRRGADFLVMDGTDVEDARSRDDAPAPVRKVHAGGWSQPRYQHRAERRWEDEANAIAADLTALAEEYRPEFVAVAGDVRMIELLRHALPARVEALVRSLGTGARTGDGGEDARRREAIRLAANAAAEDTVALLRRFEEERGQDDLAVEGVEPTLEALSRGQVETLLVHDDPDDDRQAWFTDARVPVAATAADLRSLAADEPRAGRLADVVIRAAFGTGAAVRVIPRHGPVADAIGALLRWH